MKPTIFHVVLSFVLFSGILAFPLLTSTGCKTVVTNGVTSTVFDVQRATNAISAAVPPIVRLAVAKYPQTKVYFQDASAAINLLVQSGNYDPTSLNTALSSIGIVALNNPDTVASIDAIVALYKGLYGEVLIAKLDQVQYLVPLLQAVGSSINQGLN